MQSRSLLILAALCAAGGNAQTLTPPNRTAATSTTSTPTPPPAGIHAPVPDTEANLTGHVIDALTGQHIPGVRVSLVGQNINTLTDATGHYFLKDCAVGRVEVEFTALGYAPIRREVELHSNQSQLLNIELHPASVQLNDVVVSATRNVTKRRLAPSLVNVLDTKVFSTTQSSDLSQVLNFQPGVRVENNCQNCGFSQVRINGLEGPYSQILIDSRPVFSNLAGVYGLEQLPTNMVERVEVMRGGGSALFGSSAIAGVINVITKEPTHSSAAVGHETRGLGGLNTFAHNTHLNATFVNDNNTLGLTLFGQIRHRAGYDHDGDGYTEMPLLNQRSVGMRGFVKLAPYARLTAELHANNEFRRGGDRLKEAPHNAHIAEQLDHNNLSGNVNYTQTSADGHHRFNLYASWMKVERKSYYGGGDLTVAQLLQAAQQQPLTAEGAAELEKRLVAYGHTNGLTSIVGAQYAYDFDRCLFMPAQLTLGLERSQDKLDDQSGFRPAIHQKVHTNSAFLQNEWRTERWSFLLGGRIDKHALLQKAIVSPRANLRFNPTERLVLRANYSAGFRAPQIFDEDLHVDNAGGDLVLSENAPNLREERSHSLSASADSYFQFGAWSLNLTLEGFFTQLNDAFASTQAERVRDGRTVLIRTRTNSEGARVYGANLEGRLAYRNLWNFQGGLTLQRSEWKRERQWNEDDSFTTRRMYRTPQAYAYFVTTLSPTRRIDIAFNGTFTGSMLCGHEIPTEADGTLTTFGTGTSATIDVQRLQHGPGQTATTYGPRTFTTPAFFELGTKVSYAFPLYKYYTLRLYAGVQNLFNAYQRDFDRGPARDSAYIYGPAAPRTFFAGVKVEL